MMSKLCLHVCAFYRHEVDQAITSLGYDDVLVEPYVLGCSQSFQPQASHAFPLVRAERDGIDDLVLGACALCPRSAGPSSGRMIRLGHCLELFIGHEQMAAAISGGAYLITPGWLRQWPRQIRRWGFDQETAQAFFHDFSRELLLIDTGIDPQAAAEFERLAAFLAMPHRVTFVGLDYLKLYLATIVIEWRLDSRSAQMKHVLQDANRKIADYAMAFDLLVRLSRITDEEETLAGISDLFAMLFGSTTLEYVQVVDGQVRRVFATNDSADDEAAFAQTLHTMDGDYALIAGSSGFYLRIAYQQETLGLVVVREIAFPEYRDQYLNLGLSIAKLCGLSIANARTYRMLQEAEQHLRNDRDLEHLRHVLARLTSEPNIEIVLTHVLSYAEKLIPNQLALLLLREEQTLRVISATGAADAAALIERVFDADHPFFAPIIQGQVPYILSQRAGGPAGPQIAEYAGLRSWLGVPMQGPNGVVGVLAIGSAKPAHFSATHAALAQSLANEALIAIENGRIFEKMRLMANTDPLTRLYNRRRFTELAEREFRRARRYGGPLSVIFVDIDHFKRVNDTFGHATGDQVLEQVAIRLKQVRISDLVARYGGEEFVVVCSATDLPDAQTLGERLRRIVGGQPVETTEGLVPITISVGIATLDASVTSLEDLIQRADQSLYLAKSGGRNRVCVWGAEGDGFAISNAP